MHLHPLLGFFLVRTPVHRALHRVLWVSSYPLEPPALAENALCHRFTLVALVGLVLPKTLMAGYQIPLDKFDDKTQETLVTVMFRASEKGGLRGLT